MIRGILIQGSAIAALVSLCGVSTMGAMLASDYATGDQRGYVAAFQRGDYQCTLWGKASPHFIHGRCQTPYDAMALRSGVTVCRYGVTYEDGSPMLCSNGGITVIPQPE